MLSFNSVARDREARFAIQFARVSRIMWHNPVRKATLFFAAGWQPVQKVAADGSRRV